MVNVDLDVSKLWIKAFDSVFQDIMQNHHTHYIFPGGRGSTKSSFVGGRCIPLLLIANPNVHAVCYTPQRQDILTEYPEVFAIF